MRNYIYILVLILVLFNSCKEEDGSKGFPGITTSSILDITEEGVMISADIQENGLFEILDHGFVYSTEGVANEAEMNRISLGALSGKYSFSSMIERDLVSGKKYIVKAYVKTKNRTVYGNEVSFISKGAKSPVIKSILPGTAYIGDTVKISGKFFSTQNKGNIVYFGNDLAITVSSNDSVVKVIVPDLSESATPQIKISVAEKTSVSDKRFMLKVPVIYSISPQKALPAEIIKIRGKGLLGVKMVNIENVPHSGQAVGMAVTDSTITLMLSGSLSRGKKNIQISQLDRIIPIDKQLEIVFPEILKVSPLTVWLDTVLVIKGIRIDKLSQFSTGYQNQEMIFSSDTLVKLRILNVFNTGPVRAKFQYQDVVSSQTVMLNPPVITSITPAVAHCGETIHVKGDRFLVSWQALPVNSRISIKMKRHLLFHGHSLPVLFL